MEDSVGDSSRGLLVNVQSCAKELLKSKIEQQKILDQKNDSDKQGPSRLVALKRQKEALLKEQIEAKVELELRERLSTEPLTDDSDGASLKERMKELQSVLQSCRSQLNQNNQILEYFQTRDALERLTVVSGGGASKCLSEQSELVSEVCSCVEQNQSVNHQLMLVQRERRQCQQQCRVLYNQLDKMQKSSSTQDSTEDDEIVRESLQRCRDEVCLLVHSLQSMILGCGVEWSKDQDLLELTLKLGNVDNWL